MQDLLVKPPFLLQPSFLVSASVYLQPISTKENLEVLMPPAARQMSWSWGRLKAFKWHSAYSKAVDQTA